MTSLNADSGTNYSISSGSKPLSRAVSESPSLSTEHTHNTIFTDNPIALKDIRPLFNRVYKSWSRSEHVDEDMHNLEQHYVTVDDFLRLTGNRELQKYIALIDNRIRFDEIPLSPHGEIVFHMTNFLSEQFQTTNPGNVLYGMSDNGMASAIICLLWQMFISIAA
jgi:hypothetical protein